MLKVKQWTLGSAKAVTKHHSIVNNNKCYSLTITLNPYYKSYSMDDQYNNMKQQVIDFFKEMGPNIEEAMITPEFTEDYNLHWHCYIVAKYDEMVFQQNIKHFIKQHKMLGRVFMLKKIDEVTERLKEYPFKDIQRTNHFSEALSARFNPKHYYVTPIGNILINTNNDDKVIHNGKSYKLSCIKDYIGTMKEQINKLEKII